MDYLQDLNEEQRRAVEHIDGAALVIASAGSGKTRVLTYRIAHLIANGVTPHNILALTFTNKAAREMKERIAKIVGYDYAAGLWMGTFHSVFAKILRYEAEAIGFNSSFTIYDATDAKNAVKLIIKSLQLDDSVYKPVAIYNRISAAKNNLITASAYQNSPHIRVRDEAAKRPRTGEIYEIYANKCRKANAMDFDDLLLYTNILFKNNPEILAKYQQRFTHILVDEYQDTNMAQYMIIKMLGQVHRNVFMVGDDAQSIYSFRGAKIENILNFRNDYKDAKLFKLERNYRSSQNIVNAANSVIARNKEQLKKEAYSMNDEGSKVKIIKALTDNEEGFLVVKELFNQYHQGDNTYEDFAILYRTNVQSRILEEALRKHNIPYKIYGGLSFYQRKEIKDMLAYLRLIANPNDEEALRRVINYPKRGIGLTTIDKVVNIATSEGKSMWEVLSNISAYRDYFNSGTIKKLYDFVQLIEKYRKDLEETSAFELAKDVALQTGILQEMRVDKTPEGISRYDNLNELLNGIQEFSETAQEEDNEDNLASYLENVALLTDMDKDEGDDKNHVSLMTVHASKGLEFKNVFIVGLEEKLFPSDIGGDITEKSLEEERRLFYVALTRAKERACLSFAVTRYRWGNVHQENPSRFLFELDEKYLEQDLKELTHRPAFLSRSNTFGKPKYQSSKPSYASGVNTNRPAPRFKKLSSTTAPSNFKPDEASAFEPGMRVIHSRFGAGEIMKIEGEEQNRKATVKFISFGEKTLLLKFAKLQIVK
ncbi:DNA helicase-2/ATP-dependent DNA helicase PcrA [Balneicella halophila]|uniref:DNA 3'-5' helicase n=1 Tax=Balneicella halophila TaxID=1537566 RepID=A0A7L4UMH5_BALHA|nr:UvrD-helicase domain-containing protein [Balneicella halophila]PVX49824.1 DNA helicase-2/ATP-dependent DNA helicase PcrA [Balneicella halophila]